MPRKDYDIHEWSVRSKVNAKGQYDLLRISCKEGSSDIAEVEYYPAHNREDATVRYNSRFRFNDKNLNIIWDDHDSGKQLESYQDSQCFPESELQCEEEGSGQ